MTNIEKHLENARKTIDEIRYGDCPLDLGESFLEIITAIESELEDKVILSETPTEQQLDRAVALMLNWKVTSQNGGWTEYAKQLYATMIKGD